MSKNGLTKISFWSRERSREEREVTCPFCIFPNRGRSGGFWHPANTNFPCGRTSGYFSVKGRSSFEYALRPHPPLSLKNVFLVFSRYSNRTCKNLKWFTDNSDILSLRPLPSHILDFMECDGSGLYIVLYVGWECAFL